MATTRYIAFLRAINVGGHTVTMAVLKREFEALGFRDVETFIASGNVIFSSRSGDEAALVRKIERRLQSSLGYEVATFLRTPADVGEIARGEPFPRAAMQAAAALNIGFLDAPLPGPTRKVLASLETDIDSFTAVGRELYWMCQERQSGSKVSNVALEKALKVRCTMRGMNTIVRLAARFPRT